MAKKNTGKLWIFGIVGLIAVLVAAVIYKNKNIKKGEKVTAESAELRTIKETVTASGKIFPVTEIKISSDVSGEIMELFVEEGDSVITNQILARVNADAYESQVERGRASVNGSKANLANSRAQLENLKAQKEQIQAQLLQAKEIHNRNTKLHSEGVISKADFDSSETNLLSLQANIRSSEAGIKAAAESIKAAEFNVKSTEASLKELNTSLRKTTIYAPGAGIVSRLNMEKGERVVGNGMMSGTEILRIADLNEMEVQVEVSENDIPRVSIGDAVDIEVDAYLDRTFRGKVVQIANSANSTTGIVSLTSEQVTNFVVTINVDSKSYADLISSKKPFPFRPGMSASVEIMTNEIKDVLSIPIQCVTTREKEALISKKKKGRKRGKKDGEETKKKKVNEDETIELVFIASGDTVRYVAVKTGIQDNDYIQIISGLEKGDMVITGPYSQVSKKLELGSEVRVVEQDELYEKD